MYQFTADKRGEVDRKTPLSATVSSTQEKKKKRPTPTSKILGKRKYDKLSAIARFGGSWGPSLKLNTTEDNAQTLAQLLRQKEKLKRREV